MPFKLLALDLDDTLLDKRHHISQANKEMIRRAIDEGVQVVITTGRMYASALPYYQELDLTTPMINYNGALVVNNKGEFIYHSSLDTSLAREILSVLHPYHCHINLYIDDTLYANRRGDELLTYETIAGIKGQLVEDPYSVLGTPTKMVIISFQEELLKTLTEKLNQSFGEEISLTRTRRAFLEIMPGGVSKGETLKRMTEELDLHPSQVVAVGDGSNDLSMVEYAGLGVAMENGDERLKEVAHLIAPPHDQDGVAQIIRRYILNERRASP